MNYLYSVLLELTPTSTSTLPATMGHLTHALFLDLIRQVDSPLATRLHDEPNYRPFTVSPLNGAKVQNDSLFIKPGQLCNLRVTLLDGATLWQNLSRCFLEIQPTALRIGNTEFKLNRMLSTPGSDSDGWAGFVDWPTLAATPARRTITMNFVSPTAFSLGNRQFALFPEPMLLWDSLVRVWNNYAPPVLQIDKPTLRTFISENVAVSDYALHTCNVNFPKYGQKGFVGTCSYAVHQEGEKAAQLAALAEFARYAGVGCRTTMGMGQTRTVDINPKDTH
jgi:CRISPR-associated endoribonuclease Cas6